MKKLHNKGFTLVELIVVISILIILGTIAFISIANYSKNSRDSVRISDISRMKTSLELFQIEASRYPDPNNSWAVTYSWTTAWSQWDFGQIAFQSVDKLDKLPVDPLTEEMYDYSVTSTKKEYQLSWVMETDEYTSLNKAEVNANNEIWTLRVSWNYNGETIKVQSGTTTYVLAVPSIIATEPWDLLDIITNNKLAFDWFKNLPQKYAWGYFKQIWETNPINLVNVSDFVLYSWDLNDLATDTTKQQALLTKLKNAYTWTDIVTSANISRLANLDPSSATEQEIITRWVIYWTKKSLTSDSISIATTSVTYTWCLAITQDGHSIPQLSHLQTSSHTSTGTVTTESTTMITDTYRCNNWTLEDIGQTTSLSCNATYHDEGWVCLSDTGTQPCTQSWAPANTTYNVVNVPATWDSSTSSRTTANCTWSCNSWTIISLNSCATPKTITNSLRFNSDESSHLTRTPSGAGNRKTWTWSGWVKRGNLNTSQYIFGTLKSWSTADRHALYTEGDQLKFVLNQSWTNYTWLKTDSLFRDPSAWYHVVAVFNTTETVDTDRVKLYVNGKQESLVVSAWAWSNIAYNTDYYVNDTTIHYNAKDPYLASTNYFDGYLSDVNFVDWQALNPESFGWFDADSGEWRAKEYSGSYGTNWFKLEFGDTTNVWKDTSGNGNNWDTWLTGVQKTLTPGWNAQHSTSASKIWWSSIYLDGTGDSIVTPSYSDLSLWSWNFTIEFWTKQAVSQTSSHKYMLMWAQDTSFWIATKDYRLWLWVDNDGSGWNVFNGVSGTTPLNDNVWHHIAVVRNGTSLKGYVDGVAEISLTFPSSTTTVFGDKIWIWAFANKSTIHPITGYMDEIRISKVARYTSNFTPPTTAFKSDSDTVFLLHSDTTNGSTTFIDSSPSATPNANDQMLDTPSNNFATLSPLDTWASSLYFSEWNLKIHNAGSSQSTRATIGFETGKWYYEALVIDAVDWWVWVWVLWPNASLNTWPNFAEWVAYISPALKSINGSETSYGATYGVWDTIGVVIDKDSNTIEFFKNNISQWVISNQMSDLVFPWNMDWSSWTNAKMLFNFGQWGQSDLQYCAGAGGKFKYCPPTGYKALSTANLPTPTIKDGSKHFDVVTWTGNGTSQDITGMKFSPDFVWLKDRTTAYPHLVWDVVRWASNRLITNETLAEASEPSNISWFLSNGFSVWSNLVSNKSWDNYVAWNWKAGWAAVSNTDWTITSQVSANPTAGFSVIGYTGEWYEWNYRSRIKPNSRYDCS